MNEAREMQSAACMASEAAGDLRRAVQAGKDVASNLNFTVDALSRERAQWEQLLADLRDLREGHQLARDFLARLGKSDHPSAATDPVSALGQVAADLAQALALSEGLRLGGASVHRADAAPPNLLHPPFSGGPCS